MNALDAALSLADVGLFAFPLKERRKDPAIAGWTVGEPGHETARRLFGPFPRANLGLRTGDGLVAIDLDPRKGGDGQWDEFVARREIPRTADAHTGSGGQHLLFRLPPGVPVVGNSAGWRGMAGVDIRGHHGYIVAEPSIHPDTGRPYWWIRPPHDVIAECPAWLVEALVKPPERSAKAAAPRPVAPPPCLNPATRGGDVGRLAAYLIERFPIPGIGHRVGQYVQTVPALVRRGFDDETIEGAVMGWWEFHHERGLCKDPPDVVDVRRYIASVRANPNFVMTPLIDHEAACRAIHLPDGWEDILRGLMSPPSSPPSHLSPSLTTKGVTRRVGPREIAFIGVTLVQAVHEIEMGRVGPIKFTRDQLRKMAKERYGVKWDNQQFNRMKAKFIDRPDKPPATHLSLLRQVETGQWAKAGEARPSAYEPTGLVPLIEFCRSNLRSGLGSP